MKPYKITVSEQLLARTVDALVAIQSKQQQAKEVSMARVKNLSQLEAANPEYTEQLPDRRATMQAYWHIVLIILAAIIDLIISLQAMTILCEKFGLSQPWKYFVPFGLVLLEVGLSYSQAIKQREGKGGSWIAQQLQYAVLLLLAGLSILVILYEINGYNPAIDNVSFIVFVVITIAVQLALLCATAMMHIWIIRHAVDIAESINYLKFKSDHSAVKKDIARLNNVTPSLNRQFLTETQKFIREMQSLKRQHPTGADDFMHTVPASIKHEMNKTMGHSLYLPHSQN